MATAQGAVTVMIYIQWDKGMAVPDAVRAYLRRLEDMTDDMHRNNPELDTVDISANIQRSRTIAKRYQRGAVKGLDDEPETIQR